LSSNNLKRDLIKPFNVRFASSLKLIHSVSDVHSKREKRVTNSTAKREVYQSCRAFASGLLATMRGPAGTGTPRRRPAGRSAHRLRGMYPTVDTTAAVFARDVWQHSSSGPAWKSKRRRIRRRTTCPSVNHAFRGPCNDIDFYVVVVVVIPSAGFCRVSSHERSHTHLTFGRVTVKKKWTTRERSVNSVVHRQHAASRHFDRRKTRSFAQG